jgi:hypothetical protein
MATNVKHMTVGGQQYDEVTDLQPHFKNKLDYFNKQGWGYQDSSFVLDKEVNMVKFTGNKYLYSGQYLPDFYKWIKENVGINFDEPKPKQDDMEIDAPKNVCHPFLQAIEQ